MKIRETAYNEVKLPSICGEALLVNKIVSAKGKRKNVYFLSGKVISIVI